jgi:hypothetical protein
MRMKQSREARIFGPDYDLRNPGLPPSHDPRWKALRQLFRYPRPLRVWIFQDFIVNMNVIFVCGIRVIPLWEYLHLITRRCNFGELQRECIGDKDDIDLIDKQHLRYANTRTSNYLLKISHLRADYQLSEARLTLSTLLYSRCRLESSDLRDEVFASLGLATDRDALGMKAEYAPSVTVKDVYTTTIVNIIQHEQKLDVLSNLCMHKRYKANILPSWVVDWSGLPVLQ